MNNKLNTFLDQAFAKYGDFPARADVQQELLANLTEKYVDFIGSDLQDVSFESANLTSAIFKKSSLKGSRFEGTVLDKTTFQGSDLNGISFDGLTLRGTIK